MATRRKIYPGGDLKFQLWTEIEDFFLTEDDFKVIVRDHLGRIVARITKNDCFYDADGRFYFTLERVQEGRYEALFEGEYEDDDFDKQKRTVTDRQFLCAVGRYRRPRMEFSQRCHEVHYRMVWAVSIDGADYLADCDGRYIYTSDGKRIQFSNNVSEQIEDMGKIKMKMTGEEFLQKWEGRSKDGTINTVPELFDSMEGIHDDETVQQDVNEQIDEYMNEEAAEDSDIDEMFP